MPYENFLGLDEELSAREGAAVLVLPVPYEATVSYGGGTRNGPRAILTASMQVELYDREFGRDDRRPGCAERQEHRGAPHENWRWRPDSRVRNLDCVR